MLKNSLIYKGAEPSYSRSPLELTDTDATTKNSSREEEEVEETPTSDERLVGDLSKEELAKSGVTGLEEVEEVEEVEENTDNNDIYNPNYFATATRKSLINDYTEYAKFLTEGTGINPDTLLTQLIVEAGVSRDGSQKGIAAGIRKGNNPFNIKQYSNSGVEDYYIHNDDDPNDHFIKYGSMKEGLRGYVDFLLRNKKYSEAIRAKTPEEQLRLIAHPADGTGGFATDPNYFKTLMQVYNKDIVKNRKFLRGGLIYKK